MNIVNRKKLEETLSSNWTKFIDYKSLNDIAVNSIELYAPNWSTIYSNSSTLKKLQLTKLEIQDNNQIKIWINFVIPFNEKTAVGAMELLFDLNGNYTLNNIVGNFYI